MKLVAASPILNQYKSTMDGTKAYVAIGILCTTSPEYRINRTHQYRQLLNERIPKGFRGSYEMAINKFLLRIEEYNENATSPTERMHNDVIIQQLETIGSQRREPPYKHLRCR